MKNNTQDQRIIIASVIGQLLFLTMIIMMRKTTVKINGKTSSKIPLL